MQGCKKHDYFSLSSLNIPFSNTAITVMNHLHLCTTHITVLENHKKVSFVNITRGKNRSTTNVVGIPKIGKFRFLQSYKMRLFA